MTVTPDAIREAHKAMEGAVLRTPSVYSPALSSMIDADVWLKLENQQITSSFKPRGAFTRMSALTPDEAKRGVISMSAGNHAQAVAYHAKQMGIPAVIVMPAQTPFAKINRTRAWGAEVILEGRNLNECEGVVSQIIAERGMTLIHPYNDELVMTGQGSVGLEMLADNPDLNTLIVPVGGGGLISGIAIAARDINPDIRIIGVEAELWPTMTDMVAGDDIRGGGETLAEGIAVKKPGALTMPVVRDLVDEIVLVSEVIIEQAVGVMVEQQRLVTEGAGAAGVAALLQYPEKFKGHKCGVVICGGNIDPRLLSAVLTRNMARDGRIARLRIDITDEPGMLAGITTAISSCKSNIIEIFHQRMFQDVPPKLAKIDAVIETRGGDHLQEIVQAIRDKGFTVTVLSDMSS
ncbi:MAG: threonine ammonia-lyase [Alphaproteobacteria bacterium]|nr:threonine ammonia-lyase [Alphaproteobacteria bacterium]